MWMGNKRFRNSIMSIRTAASFRSHTGRYYSKPSQSIMADQLSFGGTLPAVPSATGWTGQLGFFRKNA